MRTALSQLADESESARTDAPELGARKGILILSLILAAVVFFSALSAYEKPLWYDEICTVILCRLPNVSEIWKALDNAADTNPPFFYVITRWARQVVPDDHLGYRVLSIVGLCVTLVCTYLFSSRRVDRLSALVGAAFLLGTPLAVHGFEARPYALMVGCVSAAMLGWQRIDDSKLYALAFALALAASVSLHYYAIFVWPAFALAEASVLLSRRRIRIWAWLALVAGALPLLFFGELLLRLRQYYGQNFWARPGFGMIFAAPNYLFNSLSYWGWSFTVAGIAILLWWTFSRPAGQKGRGERALPIEECVLTVSLLLLPVIAVIAAKASGGGMTYRYMVPAILGGAVAVAFLTSKAPNALRVLLLVLMLMNYGLSVAPVAKKALDGSLLEKRAGSALAVKELGGYRASGLPIVISSGLQYLSNAYYAQEDKGVSLVALTDRQAALTFAKSDSVDLALLAMRKYFPLQVEDYGRFSSTHREFILVSGDGAGFDWWPSKLSQDGHLLTLISAKENAKIYKVVLRPQ